MFAAHGIGGATGAVLTGVFATTEVNTVSGAVDGNGMLIGEYFLLVAVS